MFHQDDTLVECASCGYEDERWRMIGEEYPYFCNMGCKLEYAGLTQADIEDLESE